jgi:hypothetical protein
MEVGDLVRHPDAVAHTGGEECVAGIIVEVLELEDYDSDEGVMVLWDHGEICYSPVNELEALNGSW